MGVLQNFGIPLLGPLIPKGGAHPASKFCNTFDFIFPKNRNMKTIILAIFILSITACGTNTSREISSVNPINWKKRTVQEELSDSLLFGKTYLSVYSEIYNLSEKMTRTLTATVSMRNINTSDTIYILNTSYYNTAGEIVRTYFDQPIYLKPMETVEIIIDNHDLEGGTGANFVFDWKIKPQVEKPFFEAVMISNMQGYSISFTTQGREYERINQE
jgi:hypothetical protein